MAGSGGAGHGAPRSAGTAGPTIDHPADLQPLDDDVEGTRPGGRRIGQGDAKGPVGDRRPCHVHRGHASAGGDGQRPYAGERRPPVAGRPCGDLPCRRDLGGRGERPDRLCHPHEPDTDTKTVRGLRRPRPRALLVGVLVIALGVGGTARLAGAQEEIPITLRAKTFRYDRNTKILTASGDVVVVYQDVTIFADRLDADLGTNDVRAEGHVRIEVGRYRVRGETLDYNLTTRRGRLTQTAADYAGPFILGTVSLRAESVEGTLGKVTTARQAFCTTCEGPNPVAFLTAKEFTVYPNDNIIAHSITVWIGGKRPLTSPVFLFFSR